ncbi:TonB-dependent receptor [Zobellia galactanivorans]|uniref:TonB-dependent receptor n=1 Tax=Zobellia galactanivorans (strain DSM 12802 / CCUG 47099 / CIP 106680 / NCIMB 13871 / Dsij) TaxID=63186 RepID=UPI0026E31D9F|nr:TonB-dependent receptor [Zobellia galactanivorans]MDO6809351.1 TonB-dependent receptor [Zobellia galactanivorans]
MMVTAKKFECPFCGICRGLVLLMPLKFNTYFNNYIILNYIAFKITNSKLLKMKQTLFGKLYFLLFFVLPTVVLAQGNLVKGVITDQGGEPLPGVNVVVKGTTDGTTSDFDGNFEIDISNMPAILIFSSIGFNTKEVSVNASGEVNVILQEGVALDEVILVGNRSKPRTVISSPVPIDNIGVEELAGTGQPTIDKMLTYKVPSFNSSTQTVSDATAHFDPADLRGLGPSRTLVLVNGKRKNQSALLYINDTPGKGEVGVDLKSIPTAAIERVEVLRDGASAQYGSDAIAGVLNMVLKKGYGTTTVNANTGITTEGDGQNFSIDLNSGVKIGDNGGFLNFTLGYYTQDQTDRSGTPGGDGLFGFLYDVEVIPIEAADGFLASNGVVATGAQIRSGDTDWQRQNPDLGVIVGQPKYQKADIFFNSVVPFKNGNGEFYAFGGFNYRVGTSYGLYRTPYWPEVTGQNSPEDHPLYDGLGQYQGFQPTFETDIRDNNFSVGVKWESAGFNFDLSGTNGRNAVDYEVNNSINVSLGSNSPTSFDVGAYSFGNNLLNLDVSRSIGQVSFGVGAELREERFTAKAGDKSSYVGGGVQSFPGLQPSNATVAKRTNYGLYGDLEWEPTDKFLIGGAIRYEDFSDFGDNFSWKLSSRYLLGERGALRGSYSTGFRAPSLHQINLSNIQTLVSGGTISNQGTFNNNDPIIREGLGVEQLTAETAKNISAGITYKLLSNFTLSLDYYNVKVDDRVLFTGEVGVDEDKTTINPVEEILNANSITTLKFFINAVDTKTTGVDFVANYTNIGLGNGELSATLAANFNETTIVGKIKTPQILADNNYDIFNRKEQARITSARPKSKVLLGLDYDINKWSVSLNNTYFGEVTWRHAINPDNDQTFTGKVLTDIGVAFNVSDKLSFNLAANNILNVYPDEIDPGDDFEVNLGGRFKYPWEVNQFGFNGTIIKAGVALKF